MKHPRLRPHPALFSKHANVATVRLICVVFQCFLFPSALREQDESWLRFAEHWWVAILNWWRSSALSSAVQQNQRLFLAPLLAEPAVLFWRSLHTPFSCLISPCGNWHSQQMLVFSVRWAYRGSWLLVAFLLWGLLFFFNSITVVYLGGCRDVLFLLVVLHTGTATALYYLKPRQREGLHKGRDGYAYSYDDGCQGGDHCGCCLVCVKQKYQAD